MEYMKKEQTEQQPTEKEIFYLFISTVQIIQIKQL